MSQMFFGMFLKKSSICIDDNVLKVYSTSCVMVVRLRILTYKAKGRPLGSYCHRTSAMYSIIQ